MLVQSTHRARQRIMDLSRADGHRRRWRVRPRRPAVHCPFAVRPLGQL